MRHAKEGDLPPQHVVLLEVARHHYFRALQTLVLAARLRENLTYVLVVIVVPIRVVVLDYGGHAGVIQAPPPPLPHCRKAVTHSK